MKEGQDPAEDGDGVGPHRESEKRSGHHGGRKGRRQGEKDPLKGRGVEGQGLARGGGFFKEPFLPGPQGGAETEHQENRAEEQKAPGERRTLCA